MPAPEHPRMSVLEPFALALEAAATATARAAKKISHSRRRTGEVLRPGPATPLWNELAAACATYLVRRGDKARLGRVLGLPRQRIHQLLVSKTACADAERTLALLGWLADQRRGRDAM